MSPGQLTFEPVIPVWLIVLLLSIGLASVLLQYWLLRKRLNRSKSLALSFLRLAAISLLISFALNPSFVARKEHRISPSLAILLETSQTMGLSVRGDSRSRLDEARELLLSGPRPLLKSLREKFDVKLYSVGESLTPVEAGDVAGLKAGGKRGDLTEALGKLQEKNAVTVLLSDGNLRWEDGHSAGPPVLSIPVGDPQEYKDVLVKAIKAPSIAFREREVTIDVIVKSYGYRGLTLPVTLKDGARLLGAKNVAIDKSPAEVSVSFAFTPEEVGQHNLSVSILPQVGESVLSNNTVELSLKVVRDKVRILMVSGNPSMNYRFMRTALKNDPSVDLLSFVILRTPTDILNVPLQEQSLIPFPVETLFTKDLKNFDLLILDNFSHQLYFNPKYLENVREFVNDGGGLAMIGGPNQFTGYAGTPIGEVLPVKLTKKEDYRRDAPSRVRLTRIGMIHPITRISSDEKDTLNLWREMPSLDGINLLEPKSSGTVLLETTEGTPRPIITVGNYGKGRAFVLSTDYSWKWYMGMVAKGKGNWAYFRFMEKMVRWLTKDPALGPIQMILPDRPEEVGQVREFKIKMREEESSSAQRGPVSISVFNPEGQRIDAELKPTGKPGEFAGTFSPQKAGTYRVKIETRAGSLEELMVVSGPLEDQDAAPDPERLRRVASSTGGKILTRNDDLLKEIEAYAAKGEKRFVEERRVPLWAMTVTLPVILVVLGMEWFWRRRWGLI